ncbi:polysaccharide deacetylase family protein [Enterococcus sp. LJL128]
MEPTNHRRATRKQRRKLDEKGSLRKKLPALFLLTTTVCAACMGYYLSQIKKQTTNAPSKQAQPAQTPEQLLMEKIAAEQKQLGNVENSRKKLTSHIQQLMYLPEVFDSSDSQQALSALLSEAAEQIDNSVDTKLVGYLTTSSSFGKILVATPTVTTYQRKGDIWTSSSVLSGTAVYKNRLTLNTPTLSELFQNPDDLSAVQLVIKQKLLETVSDSSEMIDQILSFPQVSIEQQLIAYSPQEITISLPENSLDVSELTIPLVEILPFVDSDFVDPNIIHAQAIKPLEPNKKYIALTFDDGPNPITTPRLLDILKEKQVVASFFLLGQNAAKQPDLVHRMSLEGHEVASHSYSHPKLTGLTPDAIRAEIYAADEAIYEATGKLPRSFRPPYGAVNKQAAEIINRPIVQWSVDSEDWKSKNQDKIVKRIKETSFDRSIILMHDIYEETVDAVPKVIDELRAEGYEIIPVSRLLPPKRLPVHMYFGNKDEAVTQ